MLRLENLWKLRTAIINRPMRLHVIICHKKELFPSPRAWYEMEWKMEWNGTEISVWNMEDARMESNGRFQEWNGRQSSILPYQLHTRFRALYLQKNTYRCRVVINNIVTEVFNFNSNSISTRVMLFVDKSRYFGCVHCANSVHIVSL